ncbi:MAG: RecQ family ATP-dependent DNA helicase [Saprospiraceae bacterium]|nr:RecQ family ATP-dependent DNA helicase [Saprospiraceae bacterium]
MQENPLDILKTYWGYPAFRSVQEDIIQTVLDGKDALALLPTGGGKSLCYQVPALCQEGLCLVISPLIALMQDQVYQLQKRNIPAAAIYSGMPWSEIDRIFDNAVYGGLKLLYISPERLQTEMAIARIPKMNVNLLAVDEAHCISQWGYDFRPAYLQIAEAREWLPNTPILALTATAKPDVADDICRKLLFRRNAERFQKSFLRDNLSYVVLKEEGKEEAMIRILKKVAGTSIVYVRNRRQTREIASLLSRSGIQASYYHAGLSAKDRATRQTDWIQNKIRVIVSTNAFGMGIDKPDVRSVIHLDLPEGPEAYFQEAGRAGRDGKRSFAVLIYHQEDVDRLDKQLEMQFPSIQEVRQVYRALGSYFQLATGGGIGDSYTFNLIDFCKIFDLYPGKVHYCLKQLEQDGWISLSDAVYRPSMYQILVDKEGLYDYQLKQKKYETVLKSLLRINAGAFHQPVPIREDRLAQFLKMETADLVQIFQVFKKDGILSYEEAVDQPQLVFLRERVAVEALSLDHKLIRERQIVQQTQVDAMKAYTVEKTCRNQSLLRYFGQDYTETCGICDLCLARKQKEKGSQEIREQVKDMLQKSSWNEKAFLSTFSILKQEIVGEILEEYAEEGWIKRQSGKIQWDTKSGDDS